MTTTIDDVLSLPGLTPLQLSQLKAMPLSLVKKITALIARKALAAVRSTTFKGLCAVLLELAAIIAEKGEDINGALVQKWTLRKVRDFEREETDRKLAAFLANV